MEDVYEGNSFSVKQVGPEWEIWRFCDDDGSREKLILDLEGMDELRDYFTEHYAEDRAGVAATREP